MITIKLNKKLDYQTYKQFHSLKVGGLDFGADIRHYHPKITLKNYWKYIDSYYNSHHEEMEFKSAALFEQINRHSEGFDKEVKRLFQVESSYLSTTGYLSIFYCNPRFVIDRTFQVFYLRPDLECLSTVYHEVLHFYFFVWCAKNIPGILKEYGTDSGPLWEISEVINVFIMNRPFFIEILGKEQTLAYPALSSLFNRLKLVWEKSEIIEMLVWEGINRKE